MTYVRLDVDDQVHLGSVRIDLREGVESLVEIAPDFALDGWVLRLRGGLVVDVQRGGALPVRGGAVCPGRVEGVVAVPEAAGQLVDFIPEDGKWP